MDKWVVINWYNARKPQLLKYLNEYFAILRIIDCQYFFIFHSSKDSFPSTFLFYFNHSLFIVHMFYLPFSFIVSFTRPSLVAQMAKCLPAMRETWVWFLGREDPLEKEMAIHSSTLAWKIAWTEDPDRLQSMGLQRVRHDFTFTFTLLFPFSITYLLFFVVYLIHKDLIKYFLLIPHWHVLIKLIPWT